MVAIDILFTGLLANDLQPLSKYYNFGFIRSKYGKLFSGV